MKRGISVEGNGVDYIKTPDGLKATPWEVTVHKKRGKLTLEEVQEALQESMPGIYVMVLRAPEDAEYSGWLDIEDDPGDAVTVYYVQDGDDCPVCGKLAPPFDYCPNCGKPWRESHDT